MWQFLCLVLLIAVVALAFSHFQLKARVEKLLGGVETFAREAELAVSDEAKKLYGDLKKLVSKL